MIGQRRVPGVGSRGPATRAGCRKQYGHIVIP
jgi:hypothetical protein